MNTDKCHLCNGKLFPNSVLLLKGMPKAAQFYPKKNEFAQDTGITLIIRQCSSCGLVQHDSKPVDYFKEVITAATLSEKSRQLRLNQMKELSKRFGLAGKRIIEIGTGKGEMIDVMNEAGFIAAGIEASLESVKIGKNAGRKMIYGYIGDKKKIEGSLYDAFISLNYLEHLPRPGNIIKNIYKNTTADAVGFVTVPNLEYLLRTKSFYEFVRDHISYFTGKTLTYAFEVNGFDVLDCNLINNDNDIAITVKKKKRLELSEQYVEVEVLINDLQKILNDYKAKNKKVAVWGAGHRTLALLALSKANSIEYIVDSAKFKHGKFSPIVHTPIMPPDHLRENKVDLVIVMLPGIYPDEVCKTLDMMNLDVDKAILKDNKIEFMKR